jgi:hypothetical protein
MVMKRKMERGARNVEQCKSCIQQIESFTHISLNECRTNITIGFAFLAEKFKETFENQISNPTVTIQILPRLKEPLAVLRDQLDFSCLFRSATQLNCANFDPPSR